MTTRDKILSLVGQAKPSALPLPEMPMKPKANARIDYFIDRARNNGSDIIRTSATNLNQTVRSLFPGKVISSVIIPGDLEIRSGTPVKMIAAASVAVLEAEFAVVENGALLVDETKMLHRALPFLCENLVLVVPENKLYSDMHEACAALPGESYSVFIAGPSKTADIEQALVIGAHGAKTLTIALLSD
jgi:L-lactate dehydrogenase complex protein LldG